MFNRLPKAIHMLSSCSVVGFKSKLDSYLRNIVELPCRLGFNNSLDGMDCLHGGHGLKQDFSRCKGNQPGARTYIPTISDHSIVLADCDLKATINKKPPRKVYQWSKADKQRSLEWTRIGQGTWTLNKW